MSASHFSRTSRVFLFALAAGLILAMVWIAACNNGNNELSTSTSPTVLTTGQPRSQVMRDMNSKEAFTLIDNNQGQPDFVILDVRTPEEFAAGHIAGAVLLDFYNNTFKADLNSLDKNKRYFVYCRSGNRSGQTLSLMKQMGFQEAYNLSEGINDWQAAGFPTVR